MFSFASLTGSANIAEVSIINSGIGNSGPANCSTYLKRENVTLDLYNKTTECVGEYVFKNPSNETVNLTLFFDPSFEPKNCSVLVDGEEVNTWKEKFPL